MPTPPRPGPGEVFEEDLSGGAGGSNGVVSPVMVRQVQTWLNALRYKAGTPDGKLGAQTVQAVKAYQKSRGLAVDGNITEQLRDRLHREIQKK